MVYLPTFGYFLGQMLVNIPAPWSIWDMVVSINGGTPDDLGVPPFQETSICLYKKIGGEDLMM
jgi:hypothetical protein